METTVTAGETYFYVDAPSTEEAYKTVTEVVVEATPDGEYPQGTVEIEQTLTGETESFDLSAFEELLEYGEIGEVDTSAAENASEVLLEWLWVAFSDQRKLNGPFDTYERLGHTFAELELAMFVAEDQWEPQTEDELEAAVTSLVDAAEDAGVDPESIASTVGRVAENRAGEAN